LPGSTKEGAVTPIAQPFGQGYDQADIVCVERAVSRAGMQLFDKHVRFLLKAQ